MKPQKFTSQEYLDLLLENHKQGEIDADAVKRFVRSLTSRPSQQASHNDALHAALFIAVVIAGRQEDGDLKTLVGKHLDIRKKKEMMFNPDHVLIGDAAWNIVAEKVAGNITMAQAINQFHDEVIEASDGSIRNWIKVIEPRAAGLHKLLFGDPPP